jgi:hypothetical protein
MPGTEFFFYKIPSLIKAVFCLGHIFCIPIVITFLAGIKATSVSVVKYHPPILIA